MASANVVAASSDWGNWSAKAAFVGSDGKPVNIRNDQTGAEESPTAFLFIKKEILWGEAALGARALCPEGFVRGEDIKLNLGNQSWRFRSPDGREWSAQDLYILGISRIAKLIEKHAQGQRCLVLPTFPENFPEASRRAVIEAYKKANVDILDPVSEPVAAAYYLATIEDFKKAIVVDIGHGTSDVSVVVFDGKVLRVAAHSGIPKLGGKDFRKALEDAFLKDAGLNELPNDPAFREELRVSAERAKAMLSSAGEATIVAAPPGRSPHGFTITRARFEQLVAPLATEIVNLAKGVLQEAKMRPQDVSWFLVGGGSRIPLIAKCLHDTLGVAVSSHPEAVNAIARGAALLAADRVREQGRTVVSPEGRLAVGPGMELVTAAPHTLGVLSHTQGPSSPLRLAPLIHRNTPIVPDGTPGTQDFYPISNMQRQVEFLIAQGEPGAFKEQCHIIGKLVLPLDPPGDLSTKMLATFLYDRSGCVHVTVMDTRNGRTVECDVSAPGTPSAAA